MMALLSTLILAIAVAGEPKIDALPCDDAAFSIQREVMGVNAHFTLEGMLVTPQRGYLYKFGFQTVENETAKAVIKAGQPLRTDGSFGRGLPALGSLNIREQFTLPVWTKTLTVTIQGLKPKVVSCVLVPLES